MGVLINEGDKMTGVKEIIEWITEIIAVGIITYFVIFILYPALKEATGVSIFGLGLISNGYLIIYYEAIPFLIILEQITIIEKRM